jgi:DNA polymerase/3'-5' exonuclease PolX
MSSFEEFDNIVISNSNNTHIVHQFIKYYEHIYSNYSTLNKTSQEIYYKLAAIKKNIFFISSYKRPINSGEQLEQYKGIGKKTVEKINQIIKDGFITELENIGSTKHKIKIISELENIYGIGPVKALEFYNKYNVKSFDQLVSKYKSGKLNLTDQMIMGIKYKDTLIQKIPKILILHLDIFISKLVYQLDKNFIIVFCGSYRRNKDYSSDIDILISHKKLANIDQCSFYLKQIIDLLDKYIIIDSLTKSFNTHYHAFGSFKKLVDLPTSFNKNEFNVKKNVFRIDFLIVPIQSLYTAMFHFTGSGDFNRKIRIHAKSIGMKINEYGLYKIKSGKEVSIPIKSENDIFKQLSLKSIPPEKRY